MGMCESGHKKTISFEFRQTKRLQEAIDKNTEPSIRCILELKSQSSKIFHSFLDDTKILYKNTELSPLAYSLIRGKALSFSLLISEGCDIEKMELFFSENNTFPIDIIFSKNYSELLDIYFPIYISRKDSLQNSNEIAGLQSHHPYNINDSPVHIATRMGMLGIILKVKHYLENAESWPEEFNFSSLNENGENCGLLACRHGKPFLLKHFNEVEKLDFTILNRYGENALMICLRGYEVSRNYNHYECLVYLVEVVKIDITHRCEDMLSLASFNGDVSKYLEKALEKCSIYLKAHEVKDRYISDRAVSQKFSDMYARLFLVDNRNNLDSAASAQMAVKYVEDDKRTNMIDKE